MNKVPWSREESEFLVANYRTMQDKEMAAFLTRVTGREVTTIAVKMRRNLMGIKKKRWSTFKKKKGK